jgi:hypothetical protein
MCYVEKRSCAGRRSDGSVWLVWRVSIIKLREATHTVLADVLEEALNKILGSTIEYISHHAEAYIYIRCEKIRECTTLMVCEVTVDL